MEADIRPEHEWLQQFVGEWTFEAAAQGPEGEHRVTGTETVRSVGDAWIIGESAVHEPDGRIGRNVITLGFDSERKQFVGSFISSMMTYLWVYRGELRPDQRLLVLETEGPDFGRPGRTAPYQDRFEVTGRDERVLSSYARGEDGQWSQFMTMTYKRKA